MTSPPDENLNNITEKIIGCAYRVSNTLGSGFLEKVYENTLAHEIRKAGLQVKQQHPISVTYDGVIVGDYVADLLVEEKIIIELKVTTTLDHNHQAQCMNYLRATGLTLCLLMNFSRTHVEVKRIVHMFDDEKNPWKIKGTSS